MEVDTEPIRHFNLEIKIFSSVFISKYQQHFKPSEVIQTINAKIVVNLLSLGWRATQNTVTRSRFWTLDFGHRTTDNGL